MLQARTIQRLGGRQETSFDVRVIASTNADLTVAMSRGRFREDLYYRLKVYEIHVPPLRRRGAGDIKALAGAILRRLAERRRRPSPALDPEALDLLLRHKWPGNVRELENVLERMIVAAGTGSVLMPAHLPEAFGASDSLTLRVKARPGGSLPSAADIMSALEQHGFRYARTSAHLGLSRHQLYRLLKRYDIRARGTRA